MKINARIGSLKRTDTYKFGVAVSRDTDDERLVLTVGLFKTYDAAHNWASTTLALYRELPREAAELREPPDDWDLANTN